MRQRRLSPAMLLCASIGLGLAGCEAERGGGTDPSSATVATSVFSLDRVPGFGISAAAALRDDTLALHEAYRRERLVRDCMRAAGKRHAVEVAFPPGVALRVARQFDLPAHAANASAGKLADLADSNRRHLASLDDAELDAHYRTLFDESAADVRFVEASGVLPPGRADFARGGCVGASWAAIPGVYALKRALAAELERARRQTDEAFERDDELDPVCVSASGASIRTHEAMERSVATGERKDVGIDRRCGARLQASTAKRHQAARDEVLSAHREKLRAQGDAYAGSRASIDGDVAFLDFLASSTHGVELETMLLEAEDGER